jgi:hypothetical protein
MSDVAINVVASLLIAGAVAFTMAAFDAPTWAWLGIGLALYLQEIKFRSAADEKGRDR